MVRPIIARSTRVMASPESRVTKTKNQSSIVISGMPRMSSMYRMEKPRIAGRRLTRPMPTRIPMGKEREMETTASSKVR